MAILAKVVASTNAKTYANSVHASIESRESRGAGGPRTGGPGEWAERVKDYPQVSFRLPKEVRDKLVALSKMRKQPQWRLVVDSVECYLRDLPRNERTQLSRMVSRRQGVQR